MNNRQHIYWQSPEVKTLFGFDSYPDVDVVAGLEERIRLLQKVNLSEIGYQLVLSISAKIAHDYVSLYNKLNSLLDRNQCFL